MSPKVSFAQETVNDREEDDFIFKKNDIPWLSSKSSTLQGEMNIDSEIENLKKTLDQHKYQIGFLNETNDRLVMTNRKLREVWMRSIHVIKS